MCISAPANQRHSYQERHQRHRGKPMSQTITRMPLVAPDGYIKVFISECKGALRAEVKSAAAKQMIAIK